MATAPTPVAALATVKVFLNTGDEVRRFAAPPGGIASAAALRSLLADKLGASEAQGQAMSIAWRDADGDAVAVKTDSDLAEAAACAADGVLRLHVKLGQEGEKKEEKKKVDEEEEESPLRTLADIFSLIGLRPDNGDEQEEEEEDTTEEPRAAPAPAAEEAHSSPQPVVHGGVLCDGCGTGPIVGPRFKCLECPDYDLCSSCFASGIHEDHNMTRLVRPARHPFRCGFFGRRGPFSPPFHGGPPGHHHHPHGPPHHPPRPWGSMHRPHYGQAPPPFFFASCPVRPTDEDEQKEEQQEQQDSARRWHGCRRRFHKQPEEPQPEQTAPEETPREPEPEAQPAAEEPQFQWDQELRTLLEMGLQDIPTLTRALEKHSGAIAAVVADVFAGHTA